MLQRPPEALKGVHVHIELMYNSKDAYSASSQKAHDGLSTLLQIGVCFSRYIFSYVGFLLVLVKLAASRFWLKA